MLGGSSRFKARHSGVSNPSLCPSFSGVEWIMGFKIVFRLGLGVPWAYDGLGRV